MLKEAFYAEVWRRLSNEPRIPIAAGKYMEWWAPSNDLDCALIAWTFHHFGDEAKSKNVSGFIAATPHLLNGS